MVLKNCVEKILDYNEGRDPELCAIKYSMLKADPFSFFRGTCHLFYDELPYNELPDSPKVWISGDLHMQNFGSYKGDNSLVYFDINDFDESIIGPCLIDIIRLLSSIQVGASILKITESETEQLCKYFIDSYRTELISGNARWIERETAKGMVKDLLNSLKNRSRKKFLNYRTSLLDKNRSIVIDGEKALKVTEEQKEKVITFFKKYAKKQKKPDFYKVLDVAKRIAGCGSLGVERYIILVQGQGSPNKNHFLDLKQTRTSCLQSHVVYKQPAWKTEAERVSTIQKLMQAVSPALLDVVNIKDKSYILKELQPTDDKVNLIAWNGKFKRLKNVVKNMGQLTAWGQLRSGGHLGSAIADELIEFGKDDKWIIQTLKISEFISQRMKNLWREYVESDFNLKPVKQ